MTDIPTQHKSTSTVKRIWGILCKLGNRKSGHCCLIGILIIKNIMIVKSKKDMEYVRHSFTPVRNKLLNKNSKAEKHFESLLIKSGLYFRREKCNFRHGTRWSYYDFYIPFYNLYIEIDGSSHNTTEQKLIDTQKEKIVKNKVKFLVRLTNEEVLSMDSVDIEFLLRRCFEQSARKRKRHGWVYSKNRYVNVMQRKRQHGYDDIKETANFDIDESQEVWLYDNEIGNYFCFPNIIQAKFSVEMSVNEIHDLCEMKEYRKCTSRRYVFAYTLNDCEIRVMQVYG